MNKAFPEWAKYGQGYLDEKRYGLEKYGSRYEIIPEIFLVSTEVNKIEEFENLVKACDYFMVNPPFYPIEIYYFYIKHRDIVRHLFETTNSIPLKILAKTIDKNVCHNRQKMLDYLELIGEKDKKLI